MIQDIIDTLDAAIAENLPTAVRYGLAELQPVEGGTQPVVYAGDGSFTQIANDNAGSFSYWRYAGKETDKMVDIGGSACGGFEVTMPLRFVAMVDRAICPSVQNAARAASWAAIDTNDTILSTTKAILVNFSSTSVDTDSRRVYGQEFGTSLPSTTKAWVAIDINVVVTGQPECFDPCERTGTFLCRLIQSKTWAQIQQCLTDAQEAAAIAALCGGGPCPTECEVLAAITDPLTVAPCVEDDMAIAMGGSFIQRPAYTADVIVEQIGNAGKTDDVCALLPCAEALIQINGVDVATASSGDTVDLPVLQDGNPIGNWNGTQWIIPLQASNYWRAIALGT